MCSGGRAIGIIGGGGVVCWGVCVWVGWEVFGGEVWSVGVGRGVECWCGCWWEGGDEGGVGRRREGRP